MDSTSYTFIGTKIRLIYLQKNKQYYCGGQQVVQGSYITGLWIKKLIIMKKVINLLMIKF